MRLEDADEAFFGVLFLQGLQRGLHLGGVVAVVVHHQHALFLALGLHAAGSADESLQVFFRLLLPHTRLLGGGQRVGGVHPVEFAGYF